MSNECLHWMNLKNYAMLITDFSKRLNVVGIFYSVPKNWILKTRIIPLNFRNIILFQWEWRSQSSFYYLYDPATSSSFNGIICKLNSEGLINSETKSTIYTLWDITSNSNEWSNWIIWLCDVLPNSRFVYAFSPHVVLFYTKQPADC